MSDVKGKVVAITGASSGIGEAAGRLLAESGAKVILGARRADRLEAIAADIRKNKGEADLQVIDVSKREDLTSFVNKAQDRFGRLDVLISNAGLMPLSPLDDLKECFVGGGPSSWAERCGLLRHQVCGAGNFRGPTARGRRQDQSDDYFVGGGGIRARRNDIQS